MDPGFTRHLITELVGNSDVLKNKCTDDIEELDHQMKDFKKSFDPKKGENNTIFF